MDFSEAGELLPIIIELKRLGMEPDRLAWALWLAFRDMDMPSNLAYEDFAAAVRHQYEKSPAAGVPEGRAFAEAFNRQRSNNLPELQLIHNSNHAREFRNLEC